MCDSGKERSTLAANDEPLDENGEGKAEGAKIDARWWLKPETLTAAAGLITAVATLISVLNGSGGPTEGLGESTGTVVGPPLGFQAGAGRYRCSARTLVFAASKPLSTASRQLPDTPSAVSRQHRWVLP